MTVEAREAQPEVEAIHEVEAFKNDYTECLEHRGVRVVDLNDGQTELQNWDAASDDEQEDGFLTPGLYVLPEFADMVADLEHAEIRRTTAAETSAHKVFFADLKNADGSTLLPVAIKPFDASPNHALDDFMGGVRAQQNCITTFQPVGYMVGRDMNFSITALDESTESLDVRSWESVLINLEDEKFGDQRKKLSKIGELVAGLHARGVFHGDLQFKNISQNIHGEISFIDWESSTFIDPSDGEDYSGKVEHAASDLWDLYDSAARSESRYGVGLLSRFDRALKWDYFNKFILEPYMDEYARLYGEGDASIDLIADIEEALKHKIDLEESGREPELKVA